MDPIAIFGTISLVLGPISGIVVAIIVDNRSKKKAQADATVAERTVGVQEDEAYNHRIAVMIEGFTQAQARTDKELNRAIEKIEKQEGEIEALHARIDESDKHKEELVRHIVALEKQVPNPPGPIPRPAWIKHPQ